MTNGIDLSDLMPNDVAGRRRLVAESVLAAWNKALECRHTDPEGAISSARTLLKTVCQHVLDERGVTHSETLDLPVLMKMTAEQLNLAPTQRSAAVFKRIFGGAASVVEGLSSLPNVIGGAHEHGWPARPTARHAQLAVNMAGAIAMFLVEAWEARVEDDFLEIIDDSKGG
jgi:abortive infection Abi-like protein